MVSRICAVLGDGQAVSRIRQAGSHTPHWLLATRCELDNHQYFSTQAPDSSTRLDMDGHGAALITGGAEDHHQCFEYSILQIDPRDSMSRWAIVPFAHQNQLMSMWLGQ